MFILRCHLAIERKCASGLDMSLEFREVWAGYINLTVIKVQKWYKVLTLDGVNLDRDVKNNQELSLDLLQCSEVGR